jgi:hypothetical protein
LKKGGTPESIGFGVPEMNSGFLSIKRPNFEEKVVYIRSQKPGQGAVACAASTGDLQPVHLGKIVFAVSQLPRIRKYYFERQQ